MIIVPITFKKACEFITNLHRHHIAPRGWKFGCGLSNKGILIGVVVIGRPVARGNDDGFTMEVTRLCTDGTKNACSKLYSAAANASKALGYTKIITYILESEPGISLKACGWINTGVVKGRSWDTPSRPRTDKHPTVNKTRWEKKLV